MITTTPWNQSITYCPYLYLHPNRIVLSVGVDMKYSSSPIIPSLPPVIIYNSQVHYTYATIIYSYWNFYNVPLVQGTQGFFFTSAHPNFHPLTFSLGRMFDYMSSQAGTPQVTIFFQKTRFCYVGLAVNQQNTSFSAFADITQYRSCDL